MSAPGVDGVPAGDHKGTSQHVADYKDSINSFLTLPKHYKKRALGGESKDIKSLESIEADSKGNQSCCLLSLFFIESQKPAHGWSTLLG